MYDGSFFSKVNRFDELFRKLLHILKPNIHINPVIFTTMVSIMNNSYNSKKGGRVEREDVDKNVPPLFFLKKRILLLPEVLFSVVRKCRSAKLAC